MGWFSVAHTGRAGSALLVSLFAGCFTEDRVEIAPSSAAITAGSGEVQTQTFALADDEAATILSNGMELMELSRITSPSIDGNTVQATDVQFQDHLLFATYNTRGEAFRGALQVIDLADPENPVLLQEARFSQSEAHRVRVQGQYIYVAGGDQVLAATLDTFKLDDTGLHHLSTLQLPGYQTTMLQIEGDVAYATVGDVGGVAVLSLADPAAPVTTDFLSLYDARYVVDIGGGELAVLTGGATSTLARYKLGTWEQTASVAVEGVVVGAPSWGNLVGNDLYISADIGGVATFSLEGGGIAPKQIVGTSGDANGLAPVPDQRIAVLANGQEGMVAIDAQSAEDAAVLATYDVPTDSGSANAIAIEHDLIAMADGLGGIKLLRYNVNQVAGRLTTILLTLSNPGIPTETAELLAKQAVNWTSPKSPSRVIVVRDDYHNGEFQADTQFIVNLLEGLGYDVDYMEEPSDGITADHVAGYDVVWFSNPGWPLDDRKTFDTLVTFSEAGGGVILQGDDMTYESTNSYRLSPLTYLENIHNGTSFCGVAIDNNGSGNQYRVTFTDSDHPVIDGLQGGSFTYGDDIDHSVPVNRGEEVLAWATLDGSDCLDQSPVVVTFGPERAYELQGL